MAKHAFLFAALALFLLVVAANASIYRTTVVIDDEEGSPRQRGERCEEQIRRQQHLRQCQMYIRSQSEQQQGGRRQPPYYGGGEQDNEAGRQLQKCCQQLEELDTRCRCQGLEQALSKQSQQGQMEAQQMREMYDVARYVPSMCRIQPMQCEFGQQRSWY